VVIYILLLFLVESVKCIESLKTFGRTVNGVSAHQKASTYMEQGGKKADIHLWFKRDSNPVCGSPRQYVPLTMQPL